MTSSRRVEEEMDRREWLEEMRTELEMHLTGPSSIPNRSYDKSLPNK